MTSSCPARSRRRSCAARFAHAAIRGIDKRRHGDARRSCGLHARRFAAPSDVGPHAARAVGQRTRRPGQAKGLREDITPFVLVRDEVCYVGDPIAVVIAEIATSPKTRRARRGRLSSRCRRYRTAATRRSPTPRRCIAGCRATSWPTTRSATAIAIVHSRGAAHVFDLSLTQHRGCAHPIDGRGVLARHDPVEDRTTMWTSTQSPHEIRLSLVAAARRRRREAARHHAGCRRRLRRQISDLSGGGGGAARRAPARAAR